MNENKLNGYSEYFDRCSHCVNFKSYYFDEYDSDCWCIIFDDLKEDYCEKFEDCGDEFEDGKETNMLFHDNDDNINPYCKDGKSNLDRVVDKLNKLSEENELLRLTVSKLDEDNTVYILENRQYKKDIVKYRKENKKLKYINDQLEERLENSGIGVVLKMDYNGDGV